MHCLEVEHFYKNCRTFLAVAEYFAGNQDTEFLLFEHSVANGGTSQRMTFAFAFTHATAKDHRSALHTFKWLAQLFNLTVKLDRFYRIATRPDFDFVKERHEFEIEV